MGKSTEAPQSPDPRVTIPLQGAENRRTYDYQLQGMWTNTSGPFGSQTWSQTPQFNEAGYNQALSAWNQAGGAGSPGGGGTPGYFQGDSGDWVPGSGGGAGTPGAVTPMPTRDDFTTSNWTLNQTLSPEQQALYEANTQSQLSQANLLQGATGRVGEALENPFDFSRFDLTSGGLPSYGDLDPSTFNQNAADAVYNQSTRYLDPQRAQERQAMESRLADQGFVPGTPGYQQAMEQFNQSGERAYADARDRATTQGFGVGSTQFQNTLAGRGQQYGQALTSQQQGNNVMLQRLAQALQARNQPLNELNALRSGTQIQMPGGQTNSSVPNINPTDITGAMNQNYQNQLGQYNTDVASNNGLMSGLGSLGMLAAMFMSDARLKTNIRKIGETPGGSNVYRWDWKDGSGSGVGVMAQENPEASVLFPDGYLRVDYSKVR